jgi:hypothetical protein
MGNTQVVSEPTPFQNSIASFYLSAHGEEHAISVKYSRLNTRRDVIRSKLNTLYDQYSGVKTGQEVDELMDILENMKMYYAPTITTPNASAPMTNLASIGKENIRFADGRSVSSRELQHLLFLAEHSRCLTSITDENAFKDFVIKLNRAQREMFFYIFALEDYKLNVLMDTLDQEQLKDDVIERLYAQHYSPWEEGYLTLCRNETDDVIPIEDPLLARIFKLVIGRDGKFNLLDLTYDHVSHFYGAEDSYAHFGMHCVTPECLPPPTITFDNAFTICDLLNNASPIHSFLSKKAAAIGGFCKFVYDSILDPVIISKNNVNPSAKSDPQILHTDLMIIWAVLRFTHVYLNEEDCASTTDTYQISTRRTETFAPALTKRTFESQVEQPEPEPQPQPNEEDDIRIEPVKCGFHDTIGKPNVVAITTAIKDTIAATTPRQNIDDFTSKFDPLDTYVSGRVTSLLLYITETFTSLLQGGIADAIKKLVVWSSKDKPRSTGSDIKNRRSHHSLRQELELQPLQKRVRIGGNPRKNRNKTKKRKKNRRIRKTKRHI